MTMRTLIQIIESTPTSDGAGVKLRRSLGSRRGLYVDPFLLLDEFYSDNPDDYIAGFPAHPHRGFETVTYMLDGHMRHEDHLGNRGDLGPGDVQWMTAAHGIIHSEMPQQSEGRLRGFQLWLNLPSREKMKPAVYRDIPSTDIPRVLLPKGGEVRVIAGTFKHDETATRGPVNGHGNPLSTDPMYLDVHLPAGGEFTTSITAGHNAFLYAYEGSANVGGAATSAAAISATAISATTIGGAAGDAAIGESAGGAAATSAAKPLPNRAAGVLSDGDSVRVSAGAAGVRFLLLAAKPLREPVVQYGPFVMNTREEIEQALADYRDGRLATAA